MAKLDINVTTNGVNKAEREIDGLDKKIQKVEKTNTNISKSFVKLATAIGGAVGSYKALSLVNEKVIKLGLDYNKTIEEQTSGLTSLIVATSKNVSAQGKALTLQEKYNLAQKESTKNTKRIDRIKCTDASNTITNC